MIKPSISLITFLVILITYSLKAQVGIGTTSPQETLHVAGTLRVTNTISGAATSILGIDANGTFQQITLGTNLTLTGSVLNATGGGGSSVSSVVSFGFADIDVSSISNNSNVDDLDLQIGPGETNEEIVFFRLNGSGNNNFNLQGIANGTDGRHIYLLFRNTGNINVRNNQGGIVVNRFDNLQSTQNTNGDGALIELVYDATISRWLIIDFIQ